MTAREVFRRYTEAIDHGDIAAAAALVRDNFRLEGADWMGWANPSSLPRCKLSSPPSPIIQKLPAISKNAVTKCTSRPSSLEPSGTLWRRRASVPSNPRADPFICRQRVHGFRCVTTKSFAIMWSRWLVAAFAEFSAS